MRPAGRRTAGSAHRCLATGALALALAGCSGNLMESIENAIPEREPEYKSSKSLPPLEVPPDLSAAQLNDSMVVPSVSGSPGSATFSQYASGQDAQAMEVRSTAVLPSTPDVRVERSGDKRWLVVEAPPGAVWPRVRDFWLQQGFLIEREDPSIGIMETDWAEQREGIKGGFIDNLMSKLSSAFQGVATRDKFRTRLELGQYEGQTEVFVSHRGAEEVISQAPQSTPSADDTRSWQPRPADPELEAEMLARMMLFFGVQEEATEIPRVMQVHAPFPNPFSHRATILVTGGSLVRSSVTLEVYDLLGRRVIHSTSSAEGEDAVLTVEGNRLPASGIYAYRVSAGDEEHRGLLFRR